ncbi:MAG: bifunctional adenosylcobinamide kinase/adenosylcobinamide-phosphate guanylyltransferase [Pseudomonadota bacterium]
MGRMTLVLGGAKSGKSSWAQARCEEYPGPRLYLATAEARDEEMTARIARHQAERGPSWRTVEEPLDPPRVIRELKPGDVAVVLVDCLTLWLSNLMAGQNLDPGQAVERVGELARAAAAAPVPVVIVSNEVGQGIVPDNTLARAFRDAAGLGHQVLARSAAEVVFVVAGLAQRLK